MKRITSEPQVTLPPLDDDLSLHETGFDSLGFAIRASRLEGRSRHRSVYPIRGRKLSADDRRFYQGP
jgi:hypothetical protein